MLVSEVFAGALAIPTRRRPPATARAAPAPPGPPPTPEPPPPPPPPAEPRAAARPPRRRSTRATSIGALTELAERLMASMRELLAGYERVLAPAPVRAREPAPT